MIFTPCPLFYVPYKSFSLDNCDKTTRQITSSCFTVCWRKVDPSSTTISKKRYLVYIIVLSDFWWDKFLSKSIKLLSFYVSIKFFYWTRFLFHQTSINSISQSFDLFEPWILCCCPFWISSSFWASFFVLFRMQWMLVTVNKARFSLRKTLLTFSKISAMRCAVYKIEFAPWKTYSLVYRALPPLLFPLKHMACHV